MSDIVYLTAPQLAKKLGMHPKTVYANQDLPRVRIGGKVLYIESQVDQFIAMRSERKAPPKKRKRPLYDINAELRKTTDSRGR